MATSNAAMPAAGSTIPVRRNRPRFFRALRALRDPPTLRGPVALSGPLALRDPAEPTAEVSESSAAAGQPSSIIAVRCRDNAVPSVHVARVPHSSTAAEPRCQKETSVARDFPKKGRAVYRRQQASSPARECSTITLVAACDGLGEFPACQRQQRSLRFVRGFSVGLSPATPPPPRQETTHRHY